MARARAAILANGGETSNVFTRYSLAIFGQLPWHGVPAMPVELMLMPQWFPVNIWRFSYWSRTVIAPPWWSPPCAGGPASRRCRLPRAVRDAARTHPQMAPQPDR